MVSGVLICACARTLFPLRVRHVIEFTVSIALHGSTSPRPRLPPSFPLFTHCNGCLTSLLCGGSWLACKNLPQCASHGSSLHLGAGWCRHPPQPLNSMKNDSCENKNCHVWCSFGAALIQGWWAEHNPCKISKSLENYIGKDFWIVLT